MSGLKASIYTLLLALFDTLQRDIEDFGVFYILVVNLDYSYGL